MFRVSPGARSHPPAHHGGSHYTGHHHQVHVNGSAKMGHPHHETRVRDATRVNGHLEAKRVFFEGPVEVYGNMHCEESTFSMKSFLKGTGRFKECSFHADFEIHGSGVEFDKTTAKTVSVSRLFWALHPKIYLANHSYIDTLRFDVQGDVYVDGTSFVRELHNGVMHRTP